MRELKKCFIVPKETKITFRQMKEHNRTLEYTTVMDKYSSTSLDLDDKINNSTAPIIGIMVAMDVVHCMLDTHQPKTNSLDDEMAFDEDRKCTDSIIDTDSFWRFQYTPAQRLIISLPSDTYDFFVGMKNTTCTTSFE